MSRLTLLVISLMGVVLISVHSATAETCTPGHTKMVECNQCVCGSTGQGYRCTRMRCERSKRQAECSPGQTRQLDCNHCRCVRGGAWACTRRACIPPQKLIKQISKREVPVAADLRTTPCAPSDYFKVDCNTCYCKDDGSGYICTENFCAVYAGKAPNATTTEATSTTSKVEESV